jgi:hypothetical protein
MPRTPVRGARVEAYPHIRGGSGTRTTGIGDQHNVIIVRTDARVDNVRPHSRLKLTAILPLRMTW